MFLVLAFSLLSCAPPEALAGFSIAADRDYQVGDLPVALTITAVDAEGESVPYCGTAALTGVGTGPAGTPLSEISFEGGAAKLPEVVLLADEVTVRLAPPGGTIGAVHDQLTGAWKPSLRPLPGWLSILPPVAAIVIAVVLRQALLALFAGVFMGAFFVHGYEPFTALLRCFDTYLPKTLVDSDHAAIILFTLALGGMVGIIGKSGGTAALVDVIAHRARSRRSGLVTTWVAGLVVFFDDYANCLLVGNAVRPFTDRLRISREKLSYIVDSTAAPISTVALISTWVGFQIGLFEDALPNVGESGYELFLRSLPYSFYSLFTIAFVLAVAVTLRDFGPMARAERRAAQDGHVMSPNARPLMDRELTEMVPDDPARAHWTTAVVPIASVIGFVVVGLYVSGRLALGAGAAEAGLRDIIAAANSYAVLLWSSFGGGIVALVMAAARRAIRLSDALDAWMSGAKAMTMALAILVLAWALGDMCKNQLQTGLWVISQIAPSPNLVPVITFVVAGVIALATGSSFSTMAIVVPIAAPMAWALTGETSGIDPATAEAIRYATLAAVLSGAVFGDHCSPISDTTIMASMSSAADHIDHVHTQLPYALTCALASALIGYLPAGYGLSPALSLPLGVAVLVGLLYVLGRRVDDG
ncbi:Na+/H+ antiporter NhaC family protein [Haliangium sp.]|uniref:Na+/H+ antiporter NhaC family protein n=1 Tax=Haliangium sp. TaxID=2663208 RepID=UPI003D1183BA